MRYCQYCGSQLPDGAKFCSNCGAPVEQQAKPIEPKSEPKIESYSYDTGTNNNSTVKPKVSQSYVDRNAFNPPRKKRKGGCLTAIIVVVLLFICVSGFFKSDTVQQALSGSQTDSVDYWTTRKINDLHEYCKEYDYKDIARNPDDYKGKNIKITGDIIQVQEIGKSVTLRVATDDWYEEIYYCSYRYTGKEPCKLVEGDNLTFYGKCTGTEKYLTVLGSQMTIPSMDVLYFELNE